MLHDSYTHPSISAAKCKCRTRTLTAFHDDISFELKVKSL